MNQSNKTPTLILPQTLQLNRPDGPKAMPFLAVITAKPQDQNYAFSSRVYDLDRGWLSLDNDLFIPKGSEFEVGQIVMFESMEKDQTRTDKSDDKAVYFCANNPSAIFPNTNFRFHKQQEMLLHVLSRPDQNDPLSQHATAHQINSALTNRPLAKVLGMRIKLPVIFWKN